MAESNISPGQHSNFTQSILACEKLLSKTKITAPKLLIDQIYQARNELKSTKLKLDDIDQTVRQRYDKVVYKMDKTLKTLDKLLGKSDSHDSTAAFLGSHRGDKSNNSDSDSSNDENDSYGN